MDTANYTLRLEPKSSGTVLVSSVRNEFLKQGFYETETVTADGFHFGLNTPSYALEARIETDSGRQYVQQVAISLDTRLLSTEAVSSVAAELSTFACRLTDFNNTSPVVITGKAEFEPRNGVEGDAVCDLRQWIEQQIQQSKQPLKRFSSISAEDAQKWMDDFPKRKDRFVAAIREAKNRDLSS